MADLDKLRDLGDQVRPPPFASLAGTARRRDRRGAALAAGCAAVLETVRPTPSATCEPSRGPGRRASRAAATPCG